jgi:drug/metabolite transporter (DMT)-like permease
MDGAKMFLLGAMALAISQLARRSPILPRWLAPLGGLLAAALVTSGVGYLLLTPGLDSKALPGRCAQACKRDDGRA